MQEQLPRRIASERLFQGRVTNIRADRLIYTDGTEHTLEVVEHRGAYGIIATTRSDEIVLVRQYRHPTGRVLWEIPAGTAEPDEDALAGAARELREETGYRAGSMRALGALFTTPGFCDELMHFFHATGLQEGEQSLDEDERIEVGIFTAEQVEGLLHDGLIADVKTVLALLWLHGDRGQLAPVTVDI
ncbi:MAG: NUDIX hydrolase [Vulcanimicrobiaceae bacterium]